MKKCLLLACALHGATLCLPDARANNVIFRGNLHSSINNATLSINTLDQLVVGNFGPAGTDGVAIQLLPAESIDLFVLPQPSSVPVGANESFTGRGTVSGISGTQFAELGFTRGGGNIAVDAIFSNLGPGPRLIEVYVAGTLVGTATQTVTIPQVASVPTTAWPRQVGFRRNLAPHNRPAMLCKWSTPQPIALTAGPILTGDEVRVVALVPANTLDLVASVGGTGSDVPELFIDDEDVQPTCPGDLDGDGDVDITDLTILLGHFGAIGNVLASEGDLDFDGDVDIGDLSTMLANFGSVC